MSSERSPRPWARVPRFGTRRVLLLLLLGAAGWAAWRLELRVSELKPSEGGLEVLRELAAAACDPATDFEGDYVPSEGSSLIAKALGAARRTLSFALVAVAIATVGGLVLGVLASTSWWQPRIARGGGGRVLALAILSSARFVAVALRSVHELLWAVLLLAALGMSPATGVIALALPYGGGLAKVFAEMLDEAPRRSSAALEAGGCPSLRAFVFGLLPRAAPDMLAYSFYRLECGLRSSAVLGFFGYGTLGLYVKQSFEELHYREMWTYLYTMIGLILVFELWSGMLRRRLVR